MTRLQPAVEPADFQLGQPPKIHGERCTGCTQCLLVCPVAAIERRGVKCTVLDSRCILCGRCLWMCPNGALTPQESETSGRG